MTDAISRQAVEKAVHDAIATQCLQNHKTSAGEYSAIAIAAVRAIPPVASQPPQSDALREALETARDYVADVAEGNIHFNDNIKAMAAEDLTHIDAALQEQSK